MAVRGYPIRGKVGPPIRRGFRLYAPDVVCGNDLMMPGSDTDRRRVLEALADGRLTPAQVRRSACRVLRLDAGSPHPGAEEGRGISDAEYL